MSGKGSKPRPYSVDRGTFSSNWDKIFNKIRYAVKVSNGESFYYITEDTGSCADLVIETWKTREDAEEVADSIRASGVGAVEVVEWL